MMKNKTYFNFYKISLLIGLGVFLFTCDNEEMITPDNSLKVLSQTINGEKAVNGVDGIDNEVSIELIFSHTLNTSNLESALTFSSSNGNVDYSIAYSNTNSTITLTNNVRLDYETTYTISLPTGAYGQQGEELTETFTLSFTTAPFIPANVTLEADVNSISEEEESATILVNLSEPIEEDVSVLLGFSGTATQGVDYSVSATDISLPAGETSFSVVVATIQDGDIEGVETIEIVIAEVINAEELTPQMITIDLFDDDIDSNGDGVPDQGFIINEVLFDPPGGDAGDANGDGTRSSSEDEFIEFVNDSDVEVDLSGFTLFDEDQLGGDPRHTFPEGTIIPPGGIYVLFGGGNPSGNFGVAQVAASTSGNMNLNNADDNIYIFDTEGNTFLTFSTQVEGAGISFGENQSVTRIPDINGSFGLHTSANPDLNYSPGKLADGSDFSGGGGGDPGQGFIINEVLFDPPGGDAGDANGDGARSASEDEFIEFINDSDQPVDLSGFTLFDEDQLGAEPRHIFPEETVIPPGGVYVLFGGGTPTGDFGGAQVAASTSGNMNLNNSDDNIYIFDTEGNTFLTFSTQVEGAGLDFGENQSISRSPDITGDYVLHTTANPGLNFSPGTKTDGSNF